MIARRYLTDELVSVTKNGDKYIVRFTNGDKLIFNERVFLVLFEVIE